MKALSKCQGCLLIEIAQGASLRHLTPKNRRDKGDFATSHGAIFTCRTVKILAKRLTEISNELAACVNAAEASAATQSKEMESIRLETAPAQAPRDRAPGE